MNSSYFSMSAWSPRIMRMSCGLKRSEHSGQLMLMRDSEISMRRYWRRQSMQERWGQVMMSGKLSLEWRRRHSGHSSTSGPTPPATVEEEEEEEEEVEGPEADEVEAAAAGGASSVRAAEKRAEFLSLHISEWMLSMMAMPSAPPSPEGPGGPGCWSSRALWRADLDSRPRHRKREARERRLFIGAFFTECRETEDAADCRSRSELGCRCFCRLISGGGGEGCASGEPGSRSRACAGRRGSGTGPGDEARWWLGEAEGGPGEGDRPPEGPSALKTWWLLLINLVVTSNSRILAEGWGSPTVNLERAEEKGEEILIHVHIFFMSINRSVDESCSPIQQIKSSRYKRHNSRRAERGRRHYRRGCEALVDEFLLLKSTSNRPIVNMFFLHFVKVGMEQGTRDVGKHAVGWRSTLTCNGCYKFKCGYCKMLPAETLFLGGNILQ